LSLIQLIYRSHSLITPQQSAASLSAILSLAVRRNHANGVTGCLAHMDNYFVQLLEGSADNVDATFVRIWRDKRHRDVEIVLTHPVRNRAFPDWYMSEFEFSSAQTKSSFATLGLMPGRSPDAIPPSQLLLLLMAIADHKRLTA
jgi:hypothetical protein